MFLSMALLNYPSFGCEKSFRQKAKILNDFLLPVCALISCISRKNGK